MQNRSDQMMWSQLFRISKDRKVSYQRQLREMIVSAILDDKLPLEIPLPSSRELARHLGIARNTVVLAYQQLIDEGYLVARERSGYTSTRPCSMDAYASSHSNSTVSTSPRTGSGTSSFIHRNSATSSNR
jgi:DNA-binding transcriptional regulator YhcF (GntR family)